MPQHVIVREYDPRYPALYEEEAASLSRILGESLLSIHHIGSTAVPGLKSKPIIDIMAAVRSLADVDGKKGEFEEIGYECLGEFGIKGRRYLRKGGDERTHQVHVFEVGDKGNLMRHLAVRDYLIAHEDVRGGTGGSRKGSPSASPMTSGSIATGRRRSSGRWKGTPSGNTSGKGRTSGSSSARSERIGRTI